MRVKRFLALLLAAALMATLALPVGAASSSFSDISDSNTAVNADVLRLMGVVSGTGSNQFQPNENLTRAQFCAMVVQFIQKGDQVPLHATRTIFSDVTAKHWALGHVNLAATVPVMDGEKEVRLISGVGDGRFEPDTKITLAQAATILIRVLEYSSDRTGAVWPQSYMNLANSIGLTDGISAGNGDAITRAQAAQLFVNALGCKKGDGTAYYKSLGTAQEDVVLLAVNVDSEDGSAEGAVRTSQGTYLPKNENVIPTAIQGSRGALVLNDKKEIVTFLPDDSTAETITLSGNAEPSYLKASTGKQYTVSSDTPVYTSDESEGDSYLEGYTALRSGSQITMFTERGKVVAIYASGGTTVSSDAVVVMGNPSSAMFHQLTGGATGFTIQKNHQTIRMSDIQPYDVVTYSGISNTLVVSDLRLTCVYEEASPTAKAPRSITVLGNTFDVLESTWDTSRNFSQGDNVTLLLTADGKVAGMAKPSATTRSTAIGMVSGGSAEVFLPNGGTLSLSGTLTSGANLTDQLVTVSSNSRGELSASKLPVKSASGAFDAEAMTLGNYKVTAGVQIYEQVSGGTMGYVGLSGMGISSVPAGKIATFHLNSSNMVDYIVLEQVTGNSYIYGKMTITTTTTEVRVEDEKGNPILDKEGREQFEDKKTSALAVENSEGTTKIVTGSSIKHGSFGGVSIGSNGTIIKIIDLTALKNVAPTDFFESQGMTYVSVGNRNYQVSDDVQCYRTNDQDWFTQRSGQDRLTACKAASSDLTIYLDPISEMVRIVVAN